MRRVLAILAAVVLLAPGCGKEQESGGRAAALVPSDALAYVSLTLDPPAEQKRNLQAICSRFEDIPRAECGLTKVAEELARSIGLDYGRDVGPWIGAELAVAALRPPKAKDEPLTVVLVEAEDPGAAEDTLQGAAKKGDLDAAFTVVEGYVVIAPQDEKADRTQAISRIEAMATGDKPTLGEDKAFTAAVGKLHDPRLALGWWNTTGTLDTLAGSFPVPGLGEALREAQRDGAKGGRSGNVAFALYADQDAVVLEGIADAEAATSQAGGRPVLTEGLPADTLAAITAFGVGRSVSRSLEEGELEAGAELGDLLGGITRSTGLDIEQDVLSWMGGELVVAVGKPTPEGLPSVALVVEPTDPAAAAAGVAKIKTLAEVSAGTPLTPLPLAGTTAYAVPKQLVPGLQPAMALLPDRFVLASTPEYLTALSRPSVPGFGSTPEYREVAGSSKAKVAFQVVARLAAVREAVLAGLPPEQKSAYDKDVAPWVRPLRALLLRALPDEGGRFEMKLTTD